MLKLKSELLTYSYLHIERGRAWPSSLQTSRASRSNIRSHGCLVVCSPSSEVLISLVYFFKVLGGILFLLRFFRGDNTVEYLAPLWVLIDGIARSNNELLYHRISEVAIYQGMWGRIFGYGTLTLTLQGRDGKWYIPNAPRPYALRDYFSVIAEQNHNQR